MRALEALAEAPEALAAPLSPNEEVRATIAAFADTIVPGPAGGADEQPGAVEARVVEELYDPFYGISDSFPTLHADLQAATARVLRRPARFELALPYEERERVLRDRMTEAPAGGTNPLAIGYQALRVLVSTLHRWLRDGFVAGDQDTPGAPWRIRVTAAITGIVAVLERRPPMRSNSGYVTSVLARR